MSTNNMKTEKDWDAISASWFDLDDEPDGHAPMSRWTMPAAMHMFENGTPEFEKAVADYDREYFEDHPDEREKYGYKGP